MGKHRVHRCVTPDRFTGGKWTYRTEDRDVVVMAISGKWAMVRRPRCVPYVCEVKELLPT